MKEYNRMDVLRISPLEFQNEFFELENANVQLRAIISESIKMKRSIELIPQDNANFEILNRENLKEQLQICLSLYSNCVISIETYSYAILAENIDSKNVYHLFDSHATRGKSSLWSFDNIEGLIDLILIKNSNKENHFHLNPLNILKKSKVNAPELSVQKTFEIITKFVDSIFV